MAKLAKVIAAAALIAGSVAIMPGAAQARWHGDGHGGWHSGSHHGWRGGGWGWGPGFGLGLGLGYAWGYPYYYGRPYYYGPPACGWTYVRVWRNGYWVVRRVWRCW